MQSKDYLISFPPDRSHCPCSVHQGKGILYPPPPLAIATERSQADISGYLSQRILPAEVTEWGCRALGCNRILLEINTRLGTEFDLRNPFVAFSLDCCIGLDFDFATAYAYFFAAAGVRSCTTSLSCEVKTAILHWSPYSNTSEIQLGTPDNWGQYRLRDCVSRCCKQNIFGAHPRFEKWIGDYLKRWVNIYDRKPMGRPVSYRGAVGYTFQLGFIQKPYESVPRRLWDLYSNHVIPSTLITYDRSCAKCGQTGKAKLGCRIWSISHSWTNDMSRDQQPSCTLTPINSQQWEVPIPLGMSLNDIRWEILQLINQRDSTCRPSPDTLYCWLDVLCLRQRYSMRCAELQKREIQDEYEAWVLSQSLTLDPWSVEAAVADKLKSHFNFNERIRHKEWQDDVPTIGQIYRISEGVIRYFNGLGIPFTVDNWDCDRHWLNRAWTLQEIKDDSSMLTGGLINHNMSMQRTTVQFSMVEGMFKGQITSLAKILEPLRKIAAEVADATEEGGCSILEVISEMGRRHATSDIDKIAGLSFLLRSDSLPLYFNTCDPERAWLACLLSLRYAVRVEILFNFPLVRSSSEGMQVDDLSWTPTWQQIISHPQQTHLYTRPQISSTLNQEPELLEWVKKWCNGTGLVTLPIFNAIILDDCKIFLPRICIDDEQGSVCWVYKVQVNGFGPSSQMRVTTTKEQSLYGSDSDVKASIFTFCSPLYRIVRH